MSLHLTPERKSAVAWWALAAAMVAASIWAHFSLPKILYDLLLY